MKVEFAVIFVVLQLCLIVYGSWIPQDDQNDEDTENYIPRSWFDDVQRRSSSKWCGEWGDVCNPESKSAAAKCCGDMKCVCGILFKQGTCKCKQGSVFG